MIMMRVGLSGFELSHEQKQELTRRLIDAFCAVEVGQDHVLLDRTYLAVLQRKVDRSPRHRSRTLSREWLGLADRNRGSRSDPTGEARLQSRRYHSASRGRKPGRRISPLNFPRALCVHAQ